MSCKYHYYLTKKQPLLWVSVLFLLSSAGFRIAFMSSAVDLAL